MATQPKITLSAEDRTAAAFASVSRNVDKLGFNLGTLKGLAGGALGALAVPVSAGAIAQLITESASAIDDIKDLSEAVGSSVESISALDGIARDTGATLDSVSGILVKFNGVLKDADPEKGAGAVLKALNLDIEELKRLDPAEALRQVAVALDGYADNGEKARAIQELFGKSVKEAGPFLRDLAEAGALNARVTSEQAEQVDRFNKEWARLSATTQDVSRSITVELVTAINRAIDKFREGAKEGRGFLSIAAGLYADNVRQFYGFAPATTPAVGNPNDQSAAELARLTRQNQKPTLKLPPTANAGGGGRSGGGRGGAAKDPEAEAKRYLETLQKQLQATEGLSTHEKLLADIRAGNLGKVTPELQTQLEKYAKLIDADKELQAATKEAAELREDLAKKDKALADEARAVWESTREPLELLNIEQAKLQKLLDAGAISMDTFARASLDLEERYREIPEAVKETNDAASDLGMTFASAFEDAIVNASSLKDVLKGLEQDIIRIVTRKLVTEPLANWATTAIGAWASTYGFADGGVMTPSGPLPLRTYARGGVASSPQVAVYGEGSMNEAYVPLPDGRRIPVALQGGRGGQGVGGNVTHMSINFNVPATVDRRTQEQMAHMAGAAVQRANRRLS